MRECDKKEKIDEAIRMLNGLYCMLPGLFTTTPGNGLNGLKETDISDVGEILINIVNDVIETLRSTQEEEND